MNKFEARSYTNEFGQVLNPGDDVFYIGTSWKRTFVNKAKFDGVFIGDVYYWNKETKKHETRKDVVSVKVTDVPYRGVKWNPVLLKYDYQEDMKRCAILPLKRVYKLAST